MTNPEIVSCLGCAGRCCTAYIVPVTGADVWRIAMSLQLAPALFVRREPEAYPTDTGFLLRPAGTTYGLVLQHGTARRQERPCVFLLHLREGEQRCGIYDDRPLACQTYPMQWREAQAAARTDLLCPPGSWIGLERAQAPWRERLGAQDAAWRLYARVVAPWNDAVRGLPPEGGFVPEQYFEYVLNAYDAIQAHGDAAPATLDDDLAALARAYADAAH